MRIDFGAMQEAEMPCMNDGTGTMTVRMYNDERYRIIPTRIHAGGSIGLHTQTSGDDLNYVMSGVGKAVCDGVEEPLSAGVMHICPKGSRHTIVNTGDEDLVMLTIVVARRGRACPRASSCGGRTPSSGPRRWRAPCPSPSAWR